MAEKRPFRAYDGDGKYIFISYSHADSPRVYPIVEQLYLGGYNVWYDQGIENNSDLGATISDRILNCERFVLFVSGKSLRSKYVMNNEFNYAKNLGKEMIFVALDDSAPNETCWGMDLTKYQPIKGDNEAIAKLLIERLPDECRDTDKREKCDVYVYVNRGELILPAMPDFEYSISDGALTITKYIGIEDVASIPDRFEGYPVEAIAPDAFSGDIKLTVLCSDKIAELLPTGIEGLKHEIIELKESVEVIGTTAQDKSVPVIPKLENDRENYAVVSFSRNEIVTLNVMEYLRPLYEKGYNFWYSPFDKSFKGVAETVARIDDCSAYIVFMNSNISSITRITEIEMPFAMRKDKPSFLVCLDKKVNLPACLAMNTAGNFIQYEDDTTQEQMIVDLEKFLDSNGCKGRARSSEQLKKQLTDERFSYRAYMKKADDNSAPVPCVELTGIKGEQTSIVIPESLFSLPVTALSADFLGGRSDVTEVTVPDSVTDIHKDAFKGCRRGLIIRAGRKTAAQRFCRRHIRIRFKRVKR